MSPQSYFSNYGVNNFRVSLKISAALGSNQSEGAHFSLRKTVP